MSKLKKVIIGLLIMVIALPITAFGYVYYKLNSMYEKTDIKGLETFDYINKDIVNILLVGVDGENLDKGNRSDAMMILTIDNENKDIRLTSIARDTYAEIPGYSTEKLNHSYAYEGPSLLIETINKNFNIPIDKYVAVSFKSFMDIVDEIGGIEVDVEADKIEIINNVISETYEIYSEDKDTKPVELIQSSGNQNINGYQALAFSRIRYTDSAYARDERQREVISSAYNKLIGQDLGTIKDAAEIIRRNCKTNIAPLEMIEIAMKAYNIKDNDIEQLEFPLETHRKDVLKAKKGWVIEWDKEYNRNALNDFIYNYNK